METTESQTVDDFLMHHGVKGMKWGVRKKESTSAPKARGKLRRAATKTNVALNASGKVIENNSISLIFLSAQKQRQVISTTQNAALVHALAVNKDPRFKGKDIKNDAKLKAAYAKEIEKRATVTYRNEVARARGEAVSEAFEAYFDSRRERLQFRQEGTARHAEGGSAEFDLIAVYNEDGFIVNFTKPPDKSVEHSDEKSELMHYGVKGMKWGVTRDRSPQAVTVTQKRPGGNVKTSGGRNHPLSPDAAKAYEIRRKATGSKVHALSNDELRKANERLQLELNYKRLTDAQKSRGQKFVDALFKDPKRTQKKFEELVKATDKVNISKDIRKVKL